MKQRTAAVDFYVTFENKKCVINLNEAPKRLHILPAKCVSGTFIIYSVCYTSIYLPLICCVVLKEQKAAHGFQQLSSHRGHLLKTKYFRMTTNTLNLLRGAFNHGNCKL